MKKKKLNRYQDNLGKSNEVINFETIFKTVLILGIRNDR